MAQKSYTNNWTYGEISQKLGGRNDLAILPQGCEKLENFFTMLQGGITRRPPTRIISDCLNSRIEAFIVSKTDSYLLAFSANKLEIFKDGLTGLTRLTYEDPVTLTTLDYIPTEYTGSEIWEIQYAQYYNQMYIVHKNHMVKILKLTANVSFENFIITTGTTLDGLSRTLCNGVNTYPSVVSINADRLWLASTNDQPSTIWISRPYNLLEGHRNFIIFDFVTTTVPSWKPVSTWPTKTDSDGNTYYDMTDPTEFQDDIEETNKVITAECSMEIQLNSGRNDKIMWIDSLGDIVVGTQSSEWVIPFNIDPTQQSASQKSNYGSEFFQSKKLGSGFFFIQNGYSLSQYGAGENGYGFNNLSFTADHLVHSGARQVITMSSPYPMVFVVLSDGTVSVLTFDERFGIQAWSQWNVGEDKIISLAVLDSISGQKLIAVVDRGVDGFKLEYFDFSEKVHFNDRYVNTTDVGLEYKSFMQMNRYDIVEDGSNTMGMNKKMKSIVVRCLDSGVMYIGSQGKTMQKTFDAVGNKDYQKSLSGGSEKELRVQIQSFGDNPLTILSMSVDVEVN